LDGTVAGAGLQIGYGLRKNKKLLKGQEGLTKGLGLRGRFEPKGSAQYQAAAVIGGQGGGRTAELSVADHQPLVEQFYVGVDLQSLEIA